MLRRLNALTSLALCCFSLSCTSTPRRDDPRAAIVARAAITDALERYVTASRTVDADAMAVCFDANAILFEPGIHPIETRNSIRAFLKSFPGVRVESASLTSDEVDVWDGTAIMWGSYFERLAFPGQPVSAQHGKFVIQWRRQQDGAWLIERFFRVPVPESPASAPR